MNKLIGRVTVLYLSAWNNVETEEYSSCEVSEYTAQFKGDFGEIVIIPLRHIFKITINPANGGK